MVFRPVRRGYMDVEGWKGGCEDRMPVGSPPEEGRTRATDFSIAAIMARGAVDPRTLSARSPQHTGK